MSKEFVYMTETSRFEDSIDPVERFQETDTEFIIHNGYDEYVIPKSDLVYYQLREMGEEIEQQEEGRREH